MPLGFQILKLVLIGQTQQVYLRGYFALIRNLLLSLYHIYSSLSSIALAYGPFCLPAFLGLNSAIISFSYC